MTSDLISWYPPTHDLVLSQPFIDCISNGLIISDTEFRLIMVNRWIAHKLGIDPDEILGKPLGEVFPEVAERNLLEAYRLVIQSNMPLTLSNRIHRYFIKMHPAETYQKTFNEMPQSVIISPLFEKGKLVGTVTSITDMTERVITERNIQAEVEKMNVLHKIDHALSTLNIEEILQTIIENTLNLFKAEKVALYLLEHGNLHIACQNPDGQEIILNDVLLAEMKDNKASVIIPRAKQKDSMDEHQYIDMAAPLIAEGELMGVLYLEAKKSLEYGAANTALLDALASRAAVAIHNAKLHTMEKKQRELLEILKDIMINLTSELNPDTVLDFLLESISSVTCYDSGRIIIVENDHLEVVRQKGYDKFGHPDYWEKYQFTLDEFPVLERMAKTHLPIVISDVTLESDWNQSKELAHVRSFAGAPIFVRGTLTGFLILEKSEVGYYTDDYLNILSAFSMQAGIALENAHLYHKQKLLASIDGLTGISNRRSLDEILSRELDRAARYRHKTSLIILDIDHFKRYNDTYGHQIGDNVLKNLAMLMQRDLRLIDTVGRFGGEEFLIILPETDAAGAYLVADRLREKVSRMHLNAPLPEAELPELPVTISLGVATAPDNAISLESIIHAADQALYQAKKGGRNQVCVFNDPEKFISCSG